MKAVRTDNVTVTMSAAQAEAIRTFTGMLSEPAVRTLGGSRLQYEATYQLFAELDDLLGKKY